MQKLKWQISIKVAVIFSMSIAFFLIADTSKAADVGMCGSASGVDTYTIPTTNLCSAGTVGPITLTTLVSNEKVWGWNCTGTLSYSGCSADKIEDAVCVTFPDPSYSPPSTPDICIVGRGNPSQITSKSGSDPWTWTCYGNFGGKNANCSAPRKSAGQCAAPPHNGTYSSWPGFTTLCSAGYCPSGVTVFGTGPWTWTCCGYNGGALDSCKANKTACSPTWSPDVSTVCSGVGFTQTNSCDSSTRSATGTKSCPLPTLTLTASPTSIIYNNASTLSWTTTNATSCTASGDWTGAKTNTGGSQSTGNLTATKNYSLECTNAAGSSGKQTVTVDVCNNECSIGDSPICSGDNLYTCGSYDADICNDLGSTNCPYGCSAGACNPAPAATPIDNKLKPSIWKEVTP